MRVPVELLEVKKGGSPYFSSEETTHVLVLPRGRKVNVGDPVLGIYGPTTVSSVYEKDIFDARIYCLEEGTSLVNPRRIAAHEEELGSDLIQKIKDLQGPFYIEIENDQILKESGKVKIFT
jgi:hypothetical protein